MKAIVIRKLKKAYSIQELCRAFNLPLSSYYYKPVDKALKHSNIINKIKQISRDSKNTYGKRRINQELRSHGFNIGIYKTKTLMNVLKIKVIVPKKKHSYVEYNDEHKYAKNLLDRNFSPNEINTYCVSDITFIKNGDKWSYLATVMDLYSREIVGYSISDTANAKLAKTALNKAIINKKPTTSNLLFHSDQ